MLEKENIIENDLLEELLSLFQIKPLEEEHRYWLIRAGIESCFFNEFYTRGFTGINIPSPDDIEILKNMTKDNIEAFLEEKCPDDKNKGHLVGKLYNFIHEIKIGDIIVMPSSKKEKIAFGVVKSDLYLNDSLLLEESLKNLTKCASPNKRRDVKWLKIVNSTQLPAKLLLNLFSPHGLSAITDEESINIIDNNINNFFIKDDTAYMTFNIKTEENIELNDLTNYLNMTNEVINFTNNYFKNQGRVALKINLNSPGPINYFGPKELVLASAIILALIGCDFDINVLNIIRVKVKSPGILGYIKTFLEHSEKIKKMKLEYKKALINLNVSEPEKLKEMIKALEEIEKNQRDN